MGDMGKAIPNFTKALPAPQSDLTQQLLKDPYNTHFLMLSMDADAGEVETGFVFVGRQYPLAIAGESTCPLTPGHVRRNLSSSDMSWNITIYLNPSC